MLPDVERQLVALCLDLVFPLILGFLLELEPRDAVLRRPDFGFSLFDILFILTTHFLQFLQLDCFFAVSLL